MCSELLVKNAVRSEFGSGFGVVLFVMLVKGR